MPYVVSTADGHIPQGSYHLIVASAAERPTDGTKLPVVDDLEAWKAACHQEGIDFMMAEVGEIIGQQHVGTDANGQELYKPIYRMPVMSGLQSVVQQPDLVTYARPGSVSDALYSAIMNAAKKAIRRAIASIELQEPFEAPYHMTVRLSDGSVIPLTISALTEDAIKEAVRQWATK